MTTEIRDGQLIVRLDRINPYSAENKLVTIHESTRKKYYFDKDGEIYSQDKRSKKIMRMSPMRTCNRWKEKSIIISYTGKGSSYERQRRYLVKFLIARVVFSGMKFSVDDIGHLDGDYENCAPSNLYIVVRKPETDRTVKRG